MNGRAWMADRVTVRQTHVSSARSTALVMAATTVSRVLGFVRQAVINAVFGATGSADVLNAVFNIPNNLRKLMAEGALSSAFIPVLSQSAEDDAERGTASSRELVRSLLSFQYLVLIPAMALSVVFAGPITGFILDFPDAERQLLAARLFRWFIHYTLLISISAVLMGTLNSRSRFAVPAITPILFSVSVIASVLVLHRRLGMHAMSVGILAGGLAQILFQLPQFRRAGFDMLPSFSFSDPTFRRVMRRWLPVVATSGIFVVNQQIALYFASGLESGSASALQNAVVFWQLPMGIFGVSIMTVLFPRMSREAGLNQTGALRETLSFGTRGQIALLLPSAVVMGLMAPSIVAVAFQRGNFTVDDTVRAAGVLAGYCLGMVGASCFMFLQRFYYARGDYTTPTGAAIGVLVIDVGLSLWLKETPLRVVGLAVANSSAFTLGAAFLLLRARAVLGGVGGRAILTTTAKSIAAVLPVSALLIAAEVLWPRWWAAGSSLANLGRVMLLGGASVGVVGTLYVLLNVEVALVFIRRGGRRGIDRR